MKTLLTLTALAMFSTASFAAGLYPCHVTTGKVTGSTVTQLVDDGCAVSDGGHAEGNKKEKKCDYRK